MLVDGRLLVYAVEDEDSSSLVAQIPSSEVALQQSPDHVGRGAWVAWEARSQPWVDSHGTLVVHGIGGWHEDWGAAEHCQT